MNKRRQYGGGAIIIIIVIIVGMLSTLAYVLFSKQFTPTPQQTDTNVTTSPACPDDKDTAAKNGVFCSTDIGVKVNVPTIFKGKMTKIDNYDIEEGSFDPIDSHVVGQSELVFEAKISGTDNYTMTIAKEPLHSGYTGITHALRNTYFDHKTGELFNVNRTPSGSYEKDSAVPSTTVNNVRVFEATLGDAGQMTHTHFTVIHNKIIIISLSHLGYMGDPAVDPSTIDSETVFDEFKQNINTLTVLPR